MTQTVILDLDDLTTDIPALTDSFAKQMQEAVVMCMTPHHHSSGVAGDIRDLDTVLAEFQIKWTTSYSERAKRAFGDARNAAERAGEGIAILTVLALTEYTVIERAPIGGGFDFWLSRRDDDDTFLFQRDAGLEVKSLSDAKYNSEIVRAVRRGIDQAQRANHAKLPLLVLAAEFSRPVIYMVQL